MRDAVLDHMRALVEETGPSPDKTTAARATLQKHWASYQRMLDPLRAQVDRLGTTVNYNTPSDIDAQDIERQVAGIESATSALTSTIQNLKRAAGDYRKALAAR